MDTPENKDVIVDTEDTTGAAIDAEAGNTSTETKETEVKPETAKSEEDKDVEEIDFESVLLAPPEVKTEGEGEAKEELKTDDSVSQTLKSLKEIAEKLDAVPENQDANFNNLRRINRELVKGRIENLEVAEKVAQFGDIAKIEEAMAFYYGLEGYDVERGAPSALKAAEFVYKKGPELAYNLALNTMNFNAPDGRPFAEHFTQKVLGLDPSRLLDFQKISRGEVPEGYEGVIPQPEDLKIIQTAAPTFVQAFNRLGPAQKEIVKNGLAPWNTDVAVKAEALQILQDSQGKINKIQSDKAEAQQKDLDFATQLETEAMNIENQTTEAIGTRISAGLDHIQFSADPAVNATMREGVETKLFDLVHESAFVRTRAENYFKKLEIPVDRANIDRWFSRLQDNVDIKAVATVKGQKAEAERAERARSEAEIRLGAIALSMSAQVAKKVGAKLASKADPELPKNHLPSAKKENSSKENGNKVLTAKDYAAAQRAGKVIGA